MTHKQRDSLTSSILFLREILVVLSEHQSNQCHQCSIPLRVNKHCAMLRKPYETYRMYAFAKKRNVIAIRNTFDAILADMKQDGTYDRIIQEYFK